MNSQFLKNSGFVMEFHHQEHNKQLWTRITSYGIKISVLLEVASDEVTYSRIEFASKASNKLETYKTIMHLLAAEK